MGKCQFNSRTLYKRSYSVRVAAPYNAFTVKLLTFLYVLIRMQLASCKIARYENANNDEINKEIR